MRNWRIAAVTEKYPDLSIDVIMNGDRNIIGNLDPEDQKLIDYIRELHGGIKKHIPEVGSRVAKGLS